MLLTPEANHILIVEDDLDLLALTTEILQRAGYQVTGMSDPREALANTGVQSYSLVISDMNLASMNGLELCRQLKSVHPQLPVVLLTGVTDPHLASASFSAGASILVHKPVDRANLLGLAARFTHAPL